MVKHYTFYVDLFCLMELLYLSSWWQYNFLSVVQLYAGSSKANNSLEISQSRKHHSFMNIGCRSALSRITFSTPWSFAFDILANNPFIATSYNFLSKRINILTIKKQTACINTRWRRFLSLRTCEIHMSSLKRNHVISSDHIRLNSINSI